MLHTVQDGDRRIAFEGQELASVTSYTTGKPRWIELSLFKTDTGTYVLAGCGRTVVRGEVNRHWVQLADDPAGVIDRLYLHNDLGARYIPHTSQRLITLAACKDETIKSAFAVERVA